MMAKIFNSDGSVVVSEAIKSNIVTLIEEFKPGMAKPISKGRYIFYFAPLSLVLIFRTRELRCVNKCRTRILSCLTTQQ